MSMNTTLLYSMCKCSSEKS